MSLYSRIKGFFASTVNIADPAGGWLTQWAGGGPTASGVSISTEGALGLTAVWACAQAISGDVGKLPWSVRKRRDDGGSEDAKDSYAHFIVSREFNPTLSADVGIALMEQWRDLWGNAYAEIVFDGSHRPVELWPIHPSRVRVKSKGREVWYEVNRESGGSAETVMPGDMIHFRGMGDAMSGFSVIGMARESLGLTAAAENFGASFFGNDATMGIVMSTPMELKGEGRAAFEKSIEEKSKKKFRFMVLPGGVKPERMMVPPEDIQFLETRKFQGHEVCRLFRVPPHKVGFLEDATFSNIEHQAIEYATDSLQPRITGLEKEFARKLIARSQQSSLFVHCNMNALLRGDYLTRTSGYRSLISTAVMKPNEARVLEDMNPSDEDGADVLWMQGAMQPIEILVKGPPDPPPPAPAPGGFAEEKPEAEPKEDAEALRPVFEAAAVRCVKRERHALTQRKSKGDPKTSAMWATKFYRDNRLYMETSFAPCFAAAGRHPPGAKWSAFLDDYERLAAESARSGVIPDVAAQAAVIVDAAMEAIR